MKENTFYQANFNRNRMSALCSIEASLGDYSKIVLSEREGCSSKQIFCPDYHEEINALLKKTLSAFIKKEKARLVKEFEALK